ncbi:MAG: hypothetical protein H0X46_03310 [Bacteroidetes bacterium]|nr:hypothetical protein [Bacteroidota bacterium]
MKTPSSALKVLTVSVFTILIVCFVYYRVGAFDNSSSSKTDKIFYSNFEASNTIAVDSPVVPKDSLILDERTIEIMSSSKSMVMPRIYKQDTVKKTPADTTKKKPFKKSTTMSSSKSGIIYEPDSVQDTAKKSK